MNDKRKEYLKRWREDNKEHIRHYKKEYAKTHDSSFKKLQDKYKQLQQENKQLKEQLSVAQTNEETFRLEMEDITKILGLDEDTLFDDVKAYVRSLKENWIKLKKFLEEWKENEEYCYLASSPIDRCRKDVYGEILDKMQELEGSDNNDTNR